MVHFLGQNRAAVKKRPLHGQAGLITRIHATSPQMHRITTLFWSRLDSLLLKLIGFYPVVWLKYRRLKPLLCCIINFQLTVEITCSKCPSLSFTDYQAYIVHRRECKKFVWSVSGGHSELAYNPNRVRLGTPQPGSNWLSSLSGYTKCTSCGKTILT